MFLIETAVQGFQIRNLESELPFLNIICFSCSAFQDSSSLDLISTIYSPFSQLEVLRYNIYSRHRGSSAHCLPGAAWVALGRRKCPGQGNSRCRWEHRKVWREQSAPHVLSRAPKVFPKRPSTLQTSKYKKGTCGVKTILKEKL